ncbi:MAG: Gfo/Idh/MocA family oxidoreductase [Ignavibacteriae bacterium]|nr:Gfo/Idh/MocA family oxidoreductase [Ignavibacteriota bacterium]
MTSKVRYGIIGFGRFADKTIAPAIRQSPNSELVAIQNRSLAKAQSGAAEHGAPFAFDTAADIVAHPNVDAVFIVSPNSCHCQETILAAEAGKHVLCEKPMALNVTECERMITACAKNNVKLSVGQMVRLSPLVERMKHLVRSGFVGRIIRVEANFVYDARLSTRRWVLDRKIAGGGPIFDIAVHCLDTLRYVLDDEVVSVQGELTPIPTPDQTEASAQLLLRFSQGTIGSIFCSYDSAVRESFIQVMGTEARISAVDFTLSDRTTLLKLEKKNESHQIDSSVENIIVPNLYVQEVTMFSENILSNTNPVLSAENALANQRVLDKAMMLHST